MEKLATELLFYRFFAVILLLSGSAMSKEVGKNYIGQKVEINSFLFHLSHFFFFSYNYYLKNINFRTTFLDHLVTCNCMQCVSWSSCFSNLMHAWCIYTSGSLSFSLSPCACNCLIFFVNLKMILWWACRWREGVQLWKRRRAWARSMGRDS